MATVSYEMATRLRGLEKGGEEGALTARVAAVVGTERSAEARRRRSRSPPQEPRGPHSLQHEKEADHGGGAADVHGAHSVVEHLHVAVVHAEALFHGAPAGPPAGALRWEVVAASAGRVAHVGIPLLGAGFISYLAVKEAGHARAEWHSRTR